MNTRSRMPLIASATASSVPYISAVSMRDAPSSIPRRKGSTPPPYRQTPSPISGILTPVLASCFSSITVLLPEFSAGLCRGVRLAANQDSTPTGASCQSLRCLFAGAFSTLETSDKLVGKTSEARMAEISVIRKLQELDTDPERRSAELRVRIVHAVFEWRGWAWK